MKADVELAHSFANQHPARVAELAETSLTEDFAEFLTSLEPRVAARVVARAAPTAAARALGHMQASWASAVVKVLNPHLAAALLRRMDPAEQQTLLATLSGKAAKQLQLVLKYRADQAASRMDPRAPAVSRHVPVAHALEIVRLAPGGALHYVYVIDEEQRLCGVCSMRELMCAEPHELMADVMQEAPLSLIADDPLDTVVVHPGWRKVHALPVVDAAGHFLGVLRYSAFRALEAEVGRAPSSGSSSRTSTALAELFWLGASAMAHLGEAALLGREQRSKGTRS